MVSTTLLLVMLTTLVFGTFMGKVQKILVPPTEDEKEEYIEELRATSMIAGKEIARSLGTTYEEIVHPNEEVEDESHLMDSTDIFGKPPVGWTHSRFYIWFGSFDENTLRPFFIRDYTAAKIVLEDEY